MSASDGHRALGGALAVAVAVAVASATLPGCARAPDVPDTPDVSRLLSAYTAPSGTVDSSQPASWVEEGATQVDLLGGGQAHLLLARIAANALKGVDEASLPDGRGEIVRTRVDGVATVVVACGKASNETADVSVEIVDGAVTPLMWGTSHACPLLQGASPRVSYDGRFTMYRYPGTDVLVRLEGTLSGVEADVAVDFRLSGGRLETRIATPTGDVIVRRDGASVVARAANGTFRCNPAQRECARDNEVAPPSLR